MSKEDPRVAQIETRLAEVANKILRIEVSLQTNHLTEEDRQSKINLYLSLKAEYATLSNLLPRPRDLDIDA